MHILENILTLCLLLGAFILIAFCVIPSKEEKRFPPINKRCVKLNHEFKLCEIYIHDKRVCYLKNRNDYGMIRLACDKNDTFKRGDK